MGGKARILVVEDEGIVGLDIRACLESLGYEGIVVQSGEEGVELARLIQPDLVLMDIRLGEGMDGVEAALAIGDSVEVPVVYLTAYTDDPTLERAKLSQPFGYLVKPFVPKELQTTIEMALFKHDMDRELKSRERWLSATLRSIADAVVATDADGTVLFMNPKAQSLTGWKEDEAMDRKVETVLPLVDADGRALRVHPGRQALLSGRPAGRTQAGLLARNGSQVPVEETAAPIHGSFGDVDGTVMVLREASVRGEEKPAFEPAKADLSRLGSIAHDFNNHLSVILGVSELLSSELLGNEDGRQLVREITAACTRSVDLTRQLQTFAKEWAAPGSA